MPTIISVAEGCEEFYEEDVNRVIPEKEDIIEGKNQTAGFPRSSGRRVSRAE